MTTTIAASEVPHSLLNAQGCATVLDPVAIKKSSAAKMRLADKTGNIALRKEAAAEQSFADRLGGRTALLSDELKKQIQEQKEAAAAAAASSSSESQEAKPEVTEEKTEDKPEEKRTRRNKKNKEVQPTEEPAQDDQPRQRQPLKPTSQPFQPGQKAQQPLVKNPSQTNVLSSLTGTVTLPPEAIILKLDAASKQSIADKTGNLVLKRTAALEQSLADKMAYVSAPGITTTALRAGRKGFMLDPLFQGVTPVAPTPQQKPQSPPSTSPVPSPPQTQKSSAQQRTQKPQQQKPFQKKEPRSYFNNNHSQVAPSRADQRDWRQPSPATSPPTQPTTTSPPRYVAPRPSPKQEVDGADVVEIPVSKAKTVDEITMKKPLIAEPTIHPLAPAPASM